MAKDYKQRATSRYQKNSEMWQTRVSNNNPNAELLKRAKKSGELPDRFWQWLKKEEKKGWY